VTLVGVAWDERNATFYIDGKEDAVTPLTTADCRRCAATAAHLDRQQTRPARPRSRTTASWSGRV
jgi:hypothetical protein